MCAAWGTDLMAEGLPNPDKFGAAIPNCVCKLALVMMLASGLNLAASPEADLERAIHREIVLGDLKGAMEQYRDILAEPAKSREVAARALFRIGECQEKLGQRREAYESFARLTAEFRDQPEIAAQARNELGAWDAPLPGPRNLSFAQGTPGKAPPGWIVPSLPKDADYTAELRRAGCRSASGCAVLLVPANAPALNANLMQSFSAAAYRGRMVRFSAWLRLEPFDSDGRAQMFLSVDRPNGQSGFFDSMSDRPIRSAMWTRYEITCHVDQDATFINFGVVALGLLTRVWVDGVSFEVVK
jgi:hypothetical protein